MTPIPKHLLARFAKMPAPEPVAEKPPAKTCIVLRKWFLKTLKTFRKSECFTIDDIARRSGKKLGTIKHQMNPASGSRLIRLVSAAGGNPGFILERTSKPWRKPEGHVKKGLDIIGKLPAGKRFQSKDLGLANATRSTACRRAIELGLVVRVGPGPLKLSVWRRAK